MENELAAFVEQLSTLYSSLLAQAQNLLLPPAGAPPASFYMPLRVDEARYYAVRVDVSVRYVDALQLRRAAGELSLIHI